MLKKISAVRITAAGLFLGACTLEGTADLQAAGSGGLGGNTTEDLSRGDGDTDVGNEGGASDGGKGEGESCSGCLIDSKCIPEKAENPKNPCEICDPDADSTHFTPADGRTCDDGLYCTVDDVCKGGQCIAKTRECDDEVACNGVATCDESRLACVDGENKCGDALCDTELDQCVTECDGCLIGSSCIATGAKNPDNSCEFCAPTSSATSYSPNTGASCGAAPNECSSQSTCNENAECEAHYLPHGTDCTKGECNAGTCEPVPSPFDCIVPDPPTTALPEMLYITGSPTPPAAQGGSIADGKYIPIRIDFYPDAPAGVNIRTYEFFKGHVQVGGNYFALSGNAFIPEVQWTGSFETDGNSLEFSLERCDPSYDIDVDDVEYTASANGIKTFVTLENGVVVVTSYQKE